MDAAVRPGRRVGETSGGQNHPIGLIAPIAGSNKKMILLPGNAGNGPFSFQPESIGFCFPNQSRQHIPSLQGVGKGLMVFPNHQRDSQLFHIFHQSLIGPGVQSLPDGFAGRTVMGDEVPDISLPGQVALPAACHQELQPGPLPIVKNQAADIRANGRCRK